MRCTDRAVSVCFASARLWRAMSYAGILAPVPFALFKPPRGGGGAERDPDRAGSVRSVSFHFGMARCRTGPTAGVLFPLRPPCRGVAFLCAD